MFIPPEILTCVAFIGVAREDGTQVPVGPAFFLSQRIAVEGEPGYRDIHFLVTAAHVINNIALTPADEVLVRVNVDGDATKWIRTRVVDWVSHPTDSSVDVMAYRILWNPSIKWIIERFRSNIVYSSTSRPKRSISVMSCFSRGLFWPHHGESRNIPIVRIGAIAAMPMEKVTADFGGVSKKIDAYLAEVRSVGGLSGSPVFASMIGSRRGALVVSHPTPFRLLGLIRGHFDDEMPQNISARTQGRRPAERVNMGIALVVPAVKILEVLEGMLAWSRPHELQ
jgi:hypothetical protein